VLLPERAQALLGDLLGEGLDAVSGDKQTDLLDEFRVAARLIENRL
jgi:hypothetical protein